MPTAIPVTSVSMNYASAVFMGFALISVVWYVVRGRKDFTGPPVPVDVEREDEGQAVGGMNFVSGKTKEMRRDGSTDGKSKNSNENL